MENLGGWDGAATFIALVALVVSIYTWWEQRRNAGQANFTVEWESRESLLFVNSGPGPARNVTAHLTNDPQLRDETSTVAYMGARQHQRIQVLWAMGQEHPGPLTITWHDNRRGQQRAVIDVPAPPAGRSRAAGASALDKLVRDIAAEEARGEIEDNERFWDRQR